MPKNLFRWIFWIFILSGPIVLFSLVFAFASIAGPWGGVFGAIVATFLIPLMGLIFFKLKKIDFEVFQKYSIINFFWVGFVPVQALVYAMLYDYLGFHANPTLNYVILYIMTTIPIAFVALLVWLIFLYFLKKGINRSEINQDSKTLSTS